MPRPKRKLTQKQIFERNSLTEKLREMKPIPADIRKLLTIEGFIDYYYQMRELYDSYLDAYEDLERHYKAITGRRRFSDFDSLRRAITRLSK